MNKQALRKIPRPEPLPSDGASYQSWYRFITTDWQDDMLIVNFFGQDSEKGDLLPKYRFFLKQDDYITQDLRTEKTRWLNGAFHTSGYDIASSWNLHKEFRTPDDYKRLCDFLKDYEPGNTWKRRIDIWDKLQTYQESVMKLRLKERHDAELRAIDERMSCIGELPEEFLTWLHTDALKKSQYVIYTGKGKSKTRVSCVCTVCGKNFRAERRAIGLRDGARGECPECGEPVTFKSYGKFPSKKTDEIYATYIDPLNNGYCARFVLAKREFVKELFGVRQEAVQYLEVAREFIWYTRDGQFKNDAYQYDRYKNTGDLRWCHYREHNGFYYGGTSLYECYKSCLYPGNLPGAWEHTPMKYSALEILSRQTPGRAARYWNVFMEPEKYRMLEMLTKTGFLNLALSLIPDRYESWGAHGLNKDARKMEDIFQVNKQTIRMLQKMDPTEKELVVMQYAERKGVNMRPEELRMFTNIFGVRAFLLDPHRPSPLRMCNYIVKQAEKDRRKKLNDLASDWSDYLTWCRYLGKNLGDEYYFFPPDLRKAHDAVYAEYVAMKNEEERREKEQRELEAKKKMELAKKAMEEIFSLNKDIDAFSIKGRGLLLRVPASADEIKQEGEALHHCVGSYVERVAKGETMILFVRKESAPERPYYTMEFRDGHVAQCRGLRNCSMTADVKGFVDAFEKKMKQREETTRPMMMAGGEAIAG